MGGGEQLFAILEDTNPQYSGNRRSGKIGVSIETLCGMERPIIIVIRQEKDTFGTTV